MSVHTDKNTLSELPERRQRFVLAYLKSGNGTAAAIEAGYSPTSAYTEASRLLRNAQVRAAIDSQNAELRSELVADVAERRMFWTALMRGELDVPDVIDGAVVSRKPTAAERLRASELLGKSQGDFVEKLLLEGRVEHKQYVVALPSKIEDVDAWAKSVQAEVREEPAAELPVSPQPEVSP